MDRWWRSGDSLFSALPPGLDLVPLDGLRLTTQGVGFTDETPDSDIEAIVAATRQRCAGLPPLKLSLGPVDEGIGLLVQPWDPSNGSAPPSGPRSPPCGPPLPNQPTGSDPTSRSPTAAHPHPPHPSEPGWPTCGTYPP